MIENSIFIEELISEVIGSILDINWKASKSFGFESSSLSFNQKIQIIQDIKGIDKQGLKKLECIANIRNKFAHSSQIETFEDLFTKTKVGKDVKSGFIRWFFDEKGISDILPSKHEFVFKLCYYLLVDNVVDILLKVLGDHMFEVGKSDGEKLFKDKFIDRVIEHLKTVDGGVIAINDLIEETKIICRS